MSDKEAYASGTAAAAVAAAAANGTPAAVGVTGSNTHVTVVRQVMKCMSDKEAYTGSHMRFNSNRVSPA